MENLLKRQKELVEILQHLRVEIGRENIISTKQVNGLFKRLNETWNEFDENNKSLFPHKDNVQPYFVKNTFYDTQKVYQEISTILGKKLHEVDAEEESDVTFFQDVSSDLGDKKKRDRSLNISEIQLKESFTEINDLECAIESLGSLETRSEALRDQFNDWKSKFVAVQREADTYDKTKYDEHYKEYIKLCSKLQDAMNVSRNSIMGTATANIKSTADLPKIKIPDFDGNIMKWKVFYELFDQVIHQNTTLGSAAKMHFLKTYIKGDAARLINHLATTAENYDSAYKILIARYDNTRVLLGKLLDMLLDLPQLAKESCSQLKSMHDSVYECLKGIENLKVPTDNWDAIITHVMMKKLDNETRKSYECQLKKPKEPQKVVDLLAFIEARFMALETYEQGDSSISYNKKGGSHQKTRKHVACSYCSGQHFTSKCDEFIKLSEQDRINLAKEKKWCLNCLRDNHKTNECKWKFTCEKCQRNHNTLLHFDTFKKYDRNNKSSTGSAASGSKQTIQTMTINNQTSVLLATAVINVHSIHGTPMSFRALIDQGSQSAFITENAAQLLALPRLKIHATITGIGEQTKKANHSVRLTITPRMSSKFILNTDAVILEKLSSNANIGHDKNEWNHINNLQLADPTFYEKNQIDILLGAAEYAKIIKSGLVKGDEGSPIAQNTELGWIVSGNLNGHINTNSINIQSMISTTEMTDLLKKFWEINEVSSRTAYTAEEQACEEIFEKTHKRLDNGRYVVKLPLKNNKIDLGQTKNMAIATFLQLERKFAKNRDYYEQYKRFIDEYIDLGHMIETTEPAQVVNYLPHHAVFKESSTTKIRVVFDASRKSTNQKSLNDNLMIGPTMQQDLGAIIMRWRKHKIAFTADVEKMYRQILVHDDHTDLQRIIWRNSPKEKLREYKLLTVTYGTACAPYLAIKTLQQLAHDEESNYPEACKVILNDFYVDDLASGADTTEQAIKLQRDIKKTLERGGLNLRKWASNSSDLLKSIPECDREIKIQHDVIIDASATIKALGVKWNANTDTFGFKINIATNETNTKRELLSEIASLFDPLGWLAPIVIKAKILIQESWAAGIGWDDRLPEEIKNSWEKIKNELPQIENIKIPRWINTTQENKIHIHGFCDASENAYAAVVYIKTIDKNENINITLLTAKTKVAPLNKEKLTIPRLELCGATLLAELTQHVINSMQLKIDDVFLWCDSKIVLAWIKGNPNKWKTFVANRAIEINGKFKSNVWSYVQSKQNPADCASRGVFPAEFNDIELWWNGPDWLRDKNANVDNTSNEIETTSLEEKNVIVNNVYIEESTLPAMRSFMRLQRVIAYCIRFKNHCINKTKYTGALTAVEYQNAAKAIVYAVQRERFAEEIKLLQDGKELKNSNIKKLNPFIDNNGLLRVGGRLINSELQYDAKHQLLLPHSHFVTDLIIKNMHIKCLHGGPMLTESTLRQQYWIIKGYRRIKTVLHECIICRRYSRKRMQQFMGDLPKARVTGIRAFINCGIDYAGPISVRMSKGRGSKSYKAYIAVFVCLATKAIHLECASDMTTDAFLAAFYRFTARRGTVTNMYSDNGSNFVGANTLLQLKSKEEEDEYNGTIYNALAKVGTQWHFNPPASPNFGGLWEAGVKSVKTHLKKVIGDATLTFEELSTLLYQIEATLNSRPLCALSSDVNDTNALTPGHFLIGEPLLAPPEPNYLDINTNRLTRYQLIQKMHQSFWKKWNTEYLNRLQERPKWLKKIAEPKINDLVLLKEENLPPARWATGRIIKNHPGQDGLTRVVEIKIGDKIYKRPLSKICSLPSGENNMEAEHVMTQKYASNIGFIEHKGKNRVTFSILTTLMACILICVPTAAASNNVDLSPFTHHPGIYFENQGTAYLSNSKWTILAYYNLKNYLDELRGLRKSIKHMRDMCESASLNNTECMENVIQLEEHYAEINERNEIINSAGRTRQKRATLNIVGNILGDLFGILGSDFANEYARDLGKITKNENHLLQLLKNHTTITETTLNVIKKDEEVITMQTKRINEMILNVQQITNKQEKINKLTSATFHILIALTKYETIQSNILNALLDAHNKQVSTNILSPKQLKIQLQKIHSVVDANILVPGEDAHDELRALYSLMSIQATTAHGQIIFKIIMPLILNEEFQVFRLVAVPTKRENRYIWLEPASPYLLTTLKRNSFYPMNELEIGNCYSYGRQSKICERKNQLYDAQSTFLSCEIRLLNHENHLENCTFKETVIRDTWIALQEPNAWIYAIYNTPKMDVICKNQIDHTQIKGEGIIRIHPHCTIRHDTIEITAINHYADAIPGSILPEVNITVEIDDLHHSWNVHPLTLSKQNLSMLNDLLQNIKKEEKHLPENLNIHNMHHYGLGYCLLLIIISYFVFRIIKNSKKSLQPPARQIRSISMPELGAENV